MNYHNSATKCANKINFEVKWEEEINVAMKWILGSPFVTQFFQSYEKKKLKPGIP